MEAATIEAAKMVKISSAVGRGADTAVMASARGAGSAARAGSAAAGPLGRVADRRFVAAT
jgi:hypothetical protein